jgi:acetylglutamate kinase
MPTSTDAPALVALTQRLASLRAAPVVIKFGGSIQDDPAQTAQVAREVALLASAGLRPVVVHGGGKAISAALASAGIQSRFVMGQRYTDPPAMNVVEQVLCGTTNQAIVQQITQALHAPDAPSASKAPRTRAAIGLTTLGPCVLHADRAGVTDKEGHPVDLGLVGRIAHVEASVITALCDAGHVPVIAPIALDTDPAQSGGRLNVNADLAAGEIARALRPYAFVLVSDTPGVRTDPNDKASYAHTLTRANVRQLEASGAIDGGMLPKLEACLAALDAGVTHVAITDGRAPGAVLAAVLTSTFPGTTITT